MQSAWFVLVRVSTAKWDFCVPMRLQKEKRRSRSRLKHLNTASGSESLPLQGPSRLILERKEVCQR